MSRRALVIVLLVAAGCGAPPAPAGDPLDGVSADLLYQRGIEAHRRGDSERAEQYLLAALDRGLPAEQGLPALLAVCIAADRYDAALQHARGQLLRAPRDAGLHYLVAALHSAVGDVAAATDELERVFELEPDLPEAHWLLAVVLEPRADERPRVAAALTRYLALAPEGAHADEARHRLAHASPASAAPLPPAPVAPAPADPAVPAPAAAPAVPLPPAGPTAAPVTP